MSYQALYRAWRPNTFHDICGQEVITSTLMRQITTGHIAHAYLFCGSRGTGKTTTAKVFARAINCQNPQDGEPCGQCEACLQLANENNMDVMEIDAASNNGVDEIRELREKIQYPPNIGKYKVYIIDEVHMLSAGAFNALLKTLEEPPTHAVFILATTEPQKLPATILSRCQRFDFKRIPADVIISRLATVLDGIDRSAEPEALEEIARAAEGGMRDALSLMDMCLSYSTGELTHETVKDIFGTTGRAFLGDFATALLAADAGQALLLIDQLLREGRDPNVFTREVAAHFRALMMAQLVGEKLAAILEITAEDAERYAGQARDVRQETLMFIMNLFIQAEADMKWASHPRTILELCTVRACRADAEMDMQALTERVARLESALKNGIPAAPATAPASTKPATRPAPTPRPTAAPANSTPAAPDTPEAKLFQQCIDQLSQAEPSIRAQMSHMTFAGFDDGIVQVRFDRSGVMALKLLERKQDLIAQALSAGFGQSVRVNMTMADAPEKAKAIDTAQRENLKQAIDVFGRENVELTD